MERSQTRSRPPGEAPTEGLPERRDRPGPVIGAAAATLLVIVGLNNLGTGAATGPAPPVPRPSERTSPLPLPGTGARMPDLAGTTEPLATRMLEDRGIAPRVIHRFVACRPAGTVIDQEPAAGTLMAGAEPATVVVTDLTSEQLKCPEGVASDGDRALVDLLHGFSRGVAGARPPTARTLSLGLGGAAPTVTLSGPDAQNLERWRVVPPHGEAAALPVLASLVVSGGDYRVDRGPHPRCVGAVAPPAPEFAALRQVSITPTTPRDSCLDWWAVDLFLDDAGRIRGVNLDLGELVTSP